MYIADGIVIVNNEIEDVCFIYDKNIGLKYNINVDSFILINYINENPECSVESLIEEFTGIEEFLKFLISNHIIQRNQTKYKHKIKHIVKENAVRLFIECTDKCNLSCLHCYGSFGRNNHNFINLEVLRKVIKDAAELNVYEVDITGGEPFLYPHIEEIFSLLFEYGMITTLFTNLTVCTEKDITLIKEYGIKTVVTSIESYDYVVHDEFRGLKGAWRKTVDNILLLKEMGVDIKVNFVLGNHNIVDAEKTIDSICKLGVCCNIDITTPEGRAANSMFDVDKALKILKRYNDGSIAKNCGVFKRMLFIAANGDVFPCPSIRKDEFRIGNINQEITIKDWYIKMFSFMKGFVCNENCGVGECKGGCRARALAFHKCINAPDDYFCEIYEVNNNYV